MSPLQCYWEPAGHESRLEPHPSFLFLQLYFCVHWVLLQKLHTRGYANRSCLKEQVSHRDGAKDIPSPHIPKLSKLSQASSQCSMFQDQV